MKPVLYQHDWCVKYQNKIFILGHLYFFVSKNSNFLFENSENPYFYLFLNFIYANLNAKSSVDYNFYQYNKIFF